MQLPDNIMMSLDFLMWSGEQEGRKRKERQE